jgi:hypothetical protein
MSTEEPASAINPYEPLHRIATALTAFEDALDSYYTGNINRLESWAQSLDLDTNISRALSGTWWPSPLDDREWQPFRTDEGRLGTLTFKLTFGQDLVGTLGEAFIRLRSVRADLDMFGYSAASQLVQARESVERVSRHVGGLGSVCCMIKSRELGTYVKSDQREAVTEAFYDALEIAHVRLCGFWDRAAQLIGFVFFNMREFDRDVFGGVVEKVNVNVARGDPLFAEHSAWKELWSFARRPDEDGYQWLSSRRNQLSHSVSLPRSSTGVDRAHHHRSDNIGRKIAEKVRPAEPAIEMKRVAAQVRAMRIVGNSVVNLCMLGIETYGLRPWRLRPAPFVG